VWASSGSDMILPTIIIIVSLIIFTIVLVIGVAVIVLVVLGSYFSGGD